MIEIKNVNYSYGTEENATNSLCGVNLSIEKGAFVVLCGKSGCGKTTFTRLINGLIPHYYEGVFSGSISIDGKYVHTQPLAETSKQVGSVFQNPRSQFFNVDTTSELAFDCENIALPIPEIIRRMNDAASIFHIEPLLGRSIFELSGGEKQRIACASAYTVQPDVFVFDEPSSNLDVESVEQLRKVLNRLKSAGKTIIISEHRLHYLAKLADRFIYLEHGSIAKEYSAQEIRTTELQDLSNMGLRSLKLSDLTYHLQRDVTRTIKENYKQDKTIQIENLICKYQGRTILDIPALSFAGKEIVAIVGHNGAGKSTFAGCFCGITKHQGSILFDGKPMKTKTRIARSYMVMQDVNHQLFTESVMEELTLNIPKNRRMLVTGILEQMNLRAYVKNHPLTLSGGQKQRVAIGSAVCAGKEILIYDEPTSGQDYENMRATCTLIRNAAKDALISLVITHDLEFILGCCTSVLHIEDGKVADYYDLNEDGVNKIKKSFYAFEEKSS